MEKHSQLLLQKETTGCPPDIRHLFNRDYGQPQWEAANHTGINLQISRRVPPMLYVERYRRELKYVRKHDTVVTKGCHQKSSPVLSEMSDVGVPG